MLILFSFTLISALVFVGLRRGFLREKALPHILIAIYGTSLIPSLRVPYIIDDTDHLFLLSTAIESSRVTSWLFAPHNEHVIPALKALYYFCYKSFWLNPEPFHLVVILICMGVLYATYYLLRGITGSVYAAFLGASILAATNLLDLASFVTTNSHIIFCLFFFLLLFFSLHKYFSGEKRWSFVAAFSMLLLPATFSLGLSSILYIFLFRWLCVPSGYKKKLDGGKILIALSVCWGLSLIPYLRSMNAIIFAKEYQFVSATSSMEAAKLFSAAAYLVRYFYHDLLPGLLPGPYLSLALFFFAIAASSRYKKLVNWKIIGFFLIFGLSTSLIIATFRIAWGELSLSCSRYHVFPVITACLVYALLVAPLLKDKINARIIKKYSTFIYLFCLLLASYSGMIRYNRAQKVADETSVLVQRFNVELRSAFAGYLESVPEDKKVTVYDSLIIIPRAPSLTTRKGFNPSLSRYGRNLSFYAQYVLPKNIRERIVWGETTDKEFLSYLNAHSNKYLRFKPNASATSNSQ